MDSIILRLVKHDADSATKAADSGDVKKAVSHLANAATMLACALVEPDAQFFPGELEPATPPPAPSDDVYLPGGLPWTKGEPCWGLERTSGWRMVEYRTQTGTRIVPGIHRSPGTFRLADGQDIPATSVIRCTKPLPTGGE